MKFLRFGRDHVHTILLFLWVLLIVPTLTLWRNSIAWLSFMNIYAIIAAQAAAREGRKAQ